METLICKNCGPVDDYYTELKSNQNVAYCGKCNAYIKNIPYKEPQFYVGKFKNIPISQIEDMSYLKWALKEMKLSANMRDAVQKRIDHFEHLAK